VIFSNQIIPLLRQLTASRFKACPIPDTRYYNRIQITFEVFTWFKASFFEDLLRASMCCGTIFEPIDKKTGWLFVEITVEVWRGDPQCFRSTMNTAGWSANNWKWIPEEE